VTHEQEIEVVAMAISANRTQVNRPWDTLSDEWQDSCRSIARTAIAQIDLLRGSNAARFRIGERVEKHTGDYRVKGEVRGVFRAAPDSPTRYVVAHRAEGGGTFCHIYADANLRPIS
jgi:hypothetical protein